MFCHIKTKPFVMLTDGNESPSFEWILSFFSHFSTQNRERSIRNKMLDWIIQRTNGRTSETLRGHQSVNNTYSAWRDLYQVLARCKNKNFLFAGSFLVCGKKCTRMAPEMSLCSRTNLLKARNILAFSF